MSKSLCQTISVVLLLTLAAEPAMAQLEAAPLPGELPAAPAPGQSTVQPASTTVNGSLNAALTRLSKDPRDVTALVDAGNAALAMGDVDAAVGFFSRADQVQPNSPRVRAGLAGALVHSGNPYDAIPLFAEAEAAGGMNPRLNAERGLAYDLVGDNAQAQRYYRDALRAGPDDETSRRLALSQAIAGDRIGMESTLAPLLARGDKPALRVRAFALAIAGRSEEAVSIAYQTMPQELANGIAPYLRYMPRLTKAQQASAANFGHFPRAAEIGRDDPRVARFEPPSHVATAESTLLPQGKPLGSVAEDRLGSVGRQPAPVQERPAVAVAASPRAAPPDLMPRREESETPSVLASLQPPPAQVAVQTAPQPVTPPKPAIAPPVQNATPPANPSPAPVQVAATTQVPPVEATVVPVTYDLAKAQSTSAVVPQAIAATPAPTPTPTPTPVPPPVTRPAETPVVAQAIPATSEPRPEPVAPAPSQVPPPPVQQVQVAQVQAPPPPKPAPVTKPQPAKPASFADAFGDLGAPVVKPVPTSGAVDLRKITPTRPAPPKPVQPSRIWVQVGVGRDKSALGFTWRGMVKDLPDLFRKQSPSITDWGRTNRLLVGPFDSENGAKAFLTKLKKQDYDAFVWTSPAGQVVDPLPTK